MYCYGAISINIIKNISVTNSLFYTITKGNLEKIMIDKL